LKLGEEVIRHVGSFVYLGSTLSEKGGMAEDVASKITRASQALAMYGRVWKSEMPRGAKVRYLRSQVLSILLHGAEVANHSAKDLDTLGAFLARCSKTLKGRQGRVFVGRRHGKRGRGRVSLPGARELTARPRLTFVAGLLVRPICELARRMLFASVANIAHRTQSAAAADRSAFHNTLRSDLRFITPRESETELEMDDLVGEARANGVGKLRVTIKRMLPWEKKMAVLRERRWACQQADCLFKASDQKSLVRHIRQAHPAEQEALLQGRRTWTSQKGARDRRVDPLAVLKCSVPGCERSYKTQGRLVNHLRLVHGQTTTARNEE